MQSLSCVQGRQTRSHAPRKMTRGILCAPDPRLTEDARPPTAEKGTLTSAVCLTYNMCLQPRQNLLQISPPPHQALEKGPLCDSAAASSSNQRSRTRYGRTGFFFFFPQPDCGLLIFKQLLILPNGKSLNDRFHLDDYQK